MKNIKNCIVAVLLLSFFSCSSPERSPNSAQPSLSLEEDGSIDLNADEEIILYYKQENVRHESFVDMFFYENGSTFLYLTRSCNYFAYTAIRPDGKSGDWNDIYSGKASDSDCQKIKEDLGFRGFDDKCRYYQEAGIFDANAVIISDCHGALVCYAGKCLLPEEQSRLESASTWLTRLIEQGTPVHDKLRGFLMLHNNNNYYYRYGELPEGLAQYAVEDKYSNNPISPADTIIFPDEFQESLWELRSQQQQFFFDGTSEAIPLKDAEGKEYLLYLRSTFALEDENGVVQVSNSCDEWEPYNSGGNRWLHTTDTIHRGEPCRRRQSLGG